MGPPTVAVETSTESGRRRLALLDLIALTSGFALAALLVRTFWSSIAIHGAGGVAILSGTYLWLGLCMSGPVLLLLERRPRDGVGSVRRPSMRPPPGREAEIIGPLPASRYTRAELAWMSVGAYWIGAAALLLPGRLGDSPLALLLVLELLSALGLWVVVPVRRTARPPHRNWPHRMAISLLVSWPLVWGGLIYLALVR
jgi:hypothetical protein